MAKTIAFDMPHIPEGESTSGRHSTMSVVTEVIGGAYISRPVDTREAEARIDAKKRIQRQLIGCSASQLRDVERAIQRIKDLASDSEVTDA